MYVWGLETQSNNWTQQELLSGYRTRISTAYNITRGWIRHCAFYIYPHPIPPRSLWNRMTDTSQRQLPDGIRWALRMSVGRTRHGNASSSLVFGRVWCWLAAKREVGFPTGSCKYILEFRTRITMNDCVFDCFCELKIVDFVLVLG